MHFWQIHFWRRRNTFEDKGKPRSRGHHLNAWHWCGKHAKPQFLSITTLLFNRCLAGTKNLSEPDFGRWQLSEGGRMDGWIGSLIRGDCFPSLKSRSMLSRSASTSTYSLLSSITSQPTDVVGIKHDQWYLELKYFFPQIHSLSVATHSERGWEFVKFCICSNCE